MLHAIRITADPDDVSTVQLRLSIDVSEGPFTERRAHENNPPSVTTPDDGPAYQRTVLRFDSADERERILQLLTDGTLHGVDWWVVETHSCDHDEDERGSCGWTEVERHGDVPPLE